MISHGERGRLTLVWLCAQPSGGGGRAKKGEGKEGGGSGGKRKREKGDGKNGAAMLGRMADDDDEGVGDGFAQAPMAAADSEEIVTSFAHCEGGPPTPLDEPLSLEARRDRAEIEPRSPTRFASPVIEVPA